MRYPHDHENDVIYFAKTNFRNTMRKFGIKTDDRRRHAYVIGKTGMGKTTLLENMILSDIYAGHGCCYIDPHGDTAEKLLNFIPSWRINDVVYFNPADVEYPVGFNILESIDEGMKHLVAAGMMGVFKKIWEGVWSARMEYILNNTILALMDTPGTTLLGINRMLSDEEYRNQIILNVKDPIVKQFWIKEFGNYQAKFASEAVAPIQNKVGQFLSASIIRNIVAQAKSAMNIRHMMDDEKIFIVNLSKGRIGEDASRLLGGLIITKIQMSAMERVDVLEEERADFYMYVDEFQNFAVESFASILSEARKYRLNLIMAHQYIAQLTEEVRDAVFGNVGTMISFRVGSPDATFMEDEFMPRFTPEDIINLPKFNIYLKLMIDGVTSQPFSAATLAPIAVKTDSMKRVIEQSRERYSGNRAKIEAKVAEWSGFGADVDVEEEMQKVKEGKKSAKKARFSHSYDCTRCSKTFQLPVELDRSRPIYCEDCHPIIMEERKSGGGKSDKGKKEREQKKRVVEKPPKVDEGQVVEKEVEKKSVSLEALVDEPKEDQKEKPEVAPKAEIAPKQEVPRKDQPRAGEVVKPVEKEPEELQEVPKSPQKKRVPLKVVKRGDAGYEDSRSEQDKNASRKAKGEKILAPALTLAPAQNKESREPSREKIDNDQPDGITPKRKRRRRKRRRSGSEDDREKSQDQTLTQPERKKEFPQPKTEPTPKPELEPKSESQNDNGATTSVMPDERIMFD